MWYKWTDSYQMISTIQGTVYTIGDIYELLPEDFETLN